MIFFFTLPSPLFIVCYMCCKVANGGDKVSDWKECFKALVEKPDKQLQ